MDNINVSNKQTYLLTKNIYSFINLLKYYIMAKAKTKNVKNVTVETVETSNNSEFNLNELTENITEETTTEINYKDVEFLKSNNVFDFIEEGISTSSKYDEKREKRIVNGLTALQSLQTSGLVNINQNVLNLAKWWEVKTARNEVKKLIDNEAELKGYEGKRYLTDILKPEIEALSEIGDAINRIKYAITYYKPRPGSTSKFKIQMKTVTIEGVPYNVPTIQFESAKLTMTKPELKQFVLDNGVKIETEEL